MNFMNHYRLSQRSELNVLQTRLQLQVACRVCRVGPRMDNLMHAASGYNRKVKKPLERGVYILFCLAEDLPRSFSLLKAVANHNILTVSQQLKQEHHNYLSTISQHKYHRFINDKAVHCGSCSSDKHIGVAHIRRA